MVDSNEENSSGEDEVVEDSPWFTFPQQKPLFSRVRLTQRSAAANLQRLKQRVPSNPALCTSSDNERFSTPSSISKSGNITCFSRNNNETPGVTKVKLSTFDKGDRQYSEGSARKPDRVLKNISNSERANHSRRPIDYVEKCKREIEFSKPYSCLPKGILKNTAEPSLGGGVLPVLSGRDENHLPLKEKFVNRDISKNFTPDFNSNTNERSASRSVCFQCQQQKAFVIKNVEYTVISKLGRGGSSHVFQVLNTKTLQLLAVKCVDLAGADSVTAAGYLKEIELLAKMQSSHRVIKLIDHDYVESEQTLYVVMERGDTDLSTVLKESAKIGNLSIPMIMCYWTEMLKAVKEIHDNDIVHADLKPANFLFVCARLKLIDFGIASTLQNDVTSIVKNSITGTGNYMSPEAVQDPGDSSRTKVGYKSDVWSLGCILYNMLYGKTPFQHITNNFAKLRMIADPNHKIVFPLAPEGCPPSLVDAVKRCLQHDAKKRPTVAQLIQMEY